MSNEIKTRRLIVSVKGVSGDEIDHMLSSLEEVMPIRFGRTFAKQVTVRHALGESLPIGLRIVTVGDRDQIALIMGSTLLLSLNQHNARAVAGALLAAADQLAEGTHT